jgi:LmbE family N-acetylglucosaminyl deacetylase
MGHQHSIIAVGAHPDDLEIGCGGTICTLAASGFQVKCIFLSRGGCGGDPRVRVRESTIACEHLGVLPQNVLFGDFPDTRITDSIETISFLEQFANDEVFAALIPSAHDDHQDHRRAARACVSAFRRVPRLLAYESPSASAAFRPNAFVEITQFFRTKWAALRCHKSQITRDKSRFDYRSMLRLAAVRGRQVGVHFAEAFETSRLLLEPADCSVCVNHHARRRAAVGQLGGRAGESMAQ